VRFFANMPIIIKALLVIAMPLAMLSLLMIGEIQRAFKDETSMRTMFQAAGLSEAAASLVNELQKERGMSTGYLGSSGKKFSDSLKEQQSSVNRVFPAFRDSIGKNMSLIEAFPSLHEISEHLMRDMDRIKDIRQRVRKLDITVADELAYYIDLVVTTQHPMFSHRKGTKNKNMDTPKVIHTETRRTRSKLVVIALRVSV